MSLKNLFPSLEFENSCSRLELPVRNFFANLVARPEQHARFLNTLSFLEHTGSRKIQLTQGGETMTQSVLKHLAEETRHAFVLKRFAEKLGGREMGYRVEEVMGRGASRMYFGKLDSMVSRALAEHAQRQTLTYLYITALIEVRAKWFYGLYESVLENTECEVSLKPVIEEEDAHLKEMKRELSKLEENAHLGRMEHFLAKEARFFERWLWGVRRDYSQAVAQESSTPLTRELETQPKADSGPLSG